MYEKENASHNVHVLLHLTQDVEKYDLLDEFIAFRFENVMQTIKDMIRKPVKLL